LRCTISATSSLKTSPSLSLPNFHETTLERSDRIGIREHASARFQHSDREPGEILTVLISQAREFPRTVCNSDSGSVHLRRPLRATTSRYKASPISVYSWSTLCEDLHERSATRSRRLYSRVTSRNAMSTWEKKYVVVDELRSSEEKEKITERRRSAHLRKMLRCGSNGLCCHGEIILQNPDVHAAVSKRRYKITRLIIVRALAKYYNVNRIDAFVTSN